jgi:O-6-methylguanine DNA methyltransferase
MAKIPYGETKTYGEMAGALDSSAVAVGQACGRNPVPLIVPCHRVVGKKFFRRLHVWRKFEEKVAGYGELFIVLNKRQIYLLPFHSCLNL